LAHNLSPASVKHCQCGSAAIASAASANGEYEVEGREWRAEGSHPLPAWPNGWFIRVADLSGESLVFRVRDFAALCGGFAPLHFRAGHLRLCQRTGLGISLRRTG